MAKKKAAKTTGSRSKKASPTRKKRNPARKTGQPKANRGPAGGDPVSDDVQPEPADTHPESAHETPGDESEAANKTSAGAEQADRSPTGDASTVSPLDAKDATDSADAGVSRAKAGEPAGSKSPDGDDFSIADLPDEIRRRLSLQDEADQNVIDKVAAVLGWAIFVFVSLTLVWGTYQLFGGGPSDLLIEAVWVKTENESSQIQGRVTLDHEPIADANIQILVLDDQLQARPSFLRSESDGTFVGYAGDGEIAYIDAAIRKWWWIRTKAARKTLTPNAPVDATASKREVVGGFAVGAVLLLWFMASVLVALMVTPRFARRAKIKYYIVAFMAFAFPIFVASAFAIAQGRLVTDAEMHDSDRIVSLGVATVFKGTYSAETEEEWLISLTLPPTPENKMSAGGIAATQPGASASGSTGAGSTGAGSTGAGSTAGDVATGDPGNSNQNTGAGTNTTTGPNGVVDPVTSPRPNTDQNPADAPVVNNDGAARSANRKNVVKGFGAPLWVLFIAVLGAGLSTFSLIIREIDDPPNFEDFADLRHRIHKMVEHEFYIFFAPVGGAFVYQLMVLTNAANEPVTVAIAALGAGVSVQSILRRAVSTARAIAEDEGTAARDAAGNKKKVAAGAN